MRQGLSWSFGCLIAFFVDQASLELRDLPASSSEWNAGIEKTCTVMPGKIEIFLRQKNK